MKFLPDVAVKKSRGKPLQKVGVDDVDILRKDFEGRDVISHQAAYINLTTVKGIHMSRLINVILNEWAGEVIGLDDEILDQLSASHGAKGTYWECNWQSMFEVEDSQPVKIDYKIEGKKVFKDIQWFLSLGIPYANVCPCSGEMTKKEGGIPHMQRAKAIVTGEVAHDASLQDFSYDIIMKVANTVDLMPKPFMKREDELDWCQRAERTQLFVEDATREIADCLDGMFADMVVVCKHFEVIHEHNAVAVSRKGENLL